MEGLLLHLASNYLPEIEGGTGLLLSDRRPYTNPAHDSIIMTSPEELERNLVCKKLLEYIRHLVEVTCSVVKKSRKNVSLSFCSVWGSTLEDQCVEFLPDPRCGTFHKSQTLVL